MKKNTGAFAIWGKTAGWLAAAIYGALLFLLYRSALSYLIGAWNGEEYSYCWVIPPIILYMIWEKRRELKEAPTLPSWSGMVPLAIGLSLYWLGELGGEFTTLFISLWLVVIGLSLLHLGRQKLRIIAFPIFFSLAMFVPPNAITFPLSLKLKLVSSQVGVLLLQLLGMSAFREGNVIDLGYTQLQVVDACSGLRYVTPLFILGLLIAHYFRAPLWKRLFLVLSTVPLSIITNSLRIASVGLLYRYMGAAAAEGLFHDFSGWFIFMLSLGLLLLEMWGLSKLGTRGDGRGTGDEPAVSNLEPRTKRLEPVESPRCAGLSATRFSVAVVLLLATVAVARTVDFRERVPIARPLSGFPMAIGGWEGSRSAMEEKYLDFLHLSDYLIADYRDPGGKEINLYVAYNESQIKGESTHSPATCLPGSGWEFRDSGEVALPVGGASSPMRVSRAFMVKSGERMLVYYWFPQRGRVLTDLYRIKLYNFWDALTRRRTDGALVRLITPVGSGEQPDAADRRLRLFASRAVPILEGYLPK